MKEESWFAFFFKMFGATVLFLVIMILLFNLSSCVYTAIYGG